jgi:3-deoxy-D-manno-octulosonic acid (KDO) 8-phosphate synthase
MLNTARVLIPVSDTWETTEFAQKLVVIAGPCVIESEQLCFRCGGGDAEGVPKTRRDVCVQSQLGQSESNFRRSRFVVRDSKTDWLFSRVCDGGFGVPVLTDVPH